MIDFDLSRLHEFISNYVYEEVAGRDEEIHDTVQILYERLLLMNYNDGEIEKVMRALCGAEDPDDAEEISKYLRKISKDDIAFIASHFGFLYGMVYAEQLRLKF